MVQDIFKDIKLQTKFNSQGFIVINFLESSEVKALTELFDRLNKNVNNSGMVIGSLIDDVVYKRQVEDSINAIVKDKIEKHFINFEIFNSSFVYKTANTLYDFPPHQDNSMVDESKQVSVNIWIPLSDITLENGPVFVVPGSHFLRYNSFRGPNINYFYLNNPEVVYKYALPMLLKRGEVLILNHSVIHYSTPNFTADSRKAVVVALKNKNTPNLIFVYNNMINKIQVIEMDSNLKYSYEKYHFDRNEEPVGNIKYEFNYHNRILDKRELDRVLLELVKASNSINGSMFLYKFRNIMRRKVIEFKTKIFR